MDEDTKLVVLTLVLRVKKDQELSSVYYVDTKYGLLDDIKAYEFVEVPSESV